MPNSNNYPNHLGLSHSDVLYLMDALNLAIFMGTADTTAAASIRRIMEDLKAMDKQRGLDAPRTT